MHIQIQDLQHSINKIVFDKNNTNNLNLHETHSTFFTYLFLPKKWGI